MRWARCSRSSADVVARVAAPIVGPAVWSSFWAFPSTMACCDSFVPGPVWLLLHTAVAIPLSVALVHWSNINDTNGDATTAIEEHSVADVVKD